MKHFICDICKAEIDNSERKICKLGKLEDLCKVCRTSLKITSDIMASPARDKFLNDLAIVFKAVYPRAGS